MAGKYATLDSRLTQVNVWPEVLYSHGAWFAYIRIKRHNKYWLVLQQQFIIGDSQVIAAFLQQFHHSAYKLFHCFKVDLDNPFLMTAEQQDHPAYYLDINQEDEVKMLTKFDN